MSSFKSVSIIFLNVVSHRIHKNQSHFTLQITNFQRKRHTSCRINKQRRSKHCSTPGPGPTAISRKKHDEQRFYHTSLCNRQSTNTKNKPNKAVSEKRPASASQEALPIVLVVLHLASRGKQTPSYEYERICACRISWQFYSAEKGLKKHTDDKHIMTTTKK